MTTTTTQNTSSVIWCTELDLGDELPVDLRPEPADAGEARVLLRFHGEALEFIQVPVESGTVRVNLLLAQLSRGARDRLARHLTADGIDDVLSASVFDSPFACSHPVADEVKVSVVVCTRDRGAALRDCLRRLRALRYGDLEFVIVDNASSDTATRDAFFAEVGDDARFRYVFEPRPGLSCARNRGLAEATGEIIAYTDDDVAVDEAWVSAMVAGFARRPDIACVTSLVCTANLQTPAEHYFDARVSWAARCEARIYDQAPPENDTLYPYSPGLFGTGAGMGFRTGVLRELGGFDEALGAGTKTAGGEDLDAFVRVLQAGYALSYEPSSIVWHHHRSDLAGLERQMYSYGTGLTAFIAKHLIDGSTRGPLLKRIPRGVVKLASVPKATRESVGSAAVPTRSLLIRELAGMAAGPALYLVAKKRIPAPVAPTGVVSAAGV